jgi:hypothetical protein
MKRSHLPLPAMFAYSALLMLFTSFGHAQGDIQRAVNKFQQGGASIRDHVRRLPPIAPQSLYSPLAVLDDPANARLVLNNTSLQNLEVRYTIYSREGEILALDKLMVPASEIRFVLMSELLQSTGEGHRRDLGGIQLDYLGRPIGLLAQITFLRGTERSSIDGIFPEDTDFPSARQSATWSMPPASDATLILGNSSGIKVTAKLTIDSRKPEEIVLPAHGTRLINVKGEQDDERVRTRPHHATVTFDGPKGALRETGFVVADAGYGAPIRFYDRGAARQADLFATDVPARDATLAMTLFNTSEEEVAVHPQLFPIGGNLSPIDLSPVKIGPRQAVFVDLAEASASLNNGKTDSVSMHVGSSGAPGDIIGSLVSVRRGERSDEDGVSPARRDLVAEVPIHDPGSPGHSTGSYPLRFDGDYTNLVTITNVSNEEKKFLAFIAMSAAKYIFNPQVLKPGETARFDVNAIKTKQEKDAFGHALPPDLKVAKFVWSIGAPYGSARMIGRNHMVSARNGVSASFSCGVCCPGGSRGPFPTPEPGGIMGLGSFANGSVTFESTNDCQGDFTSFPGTLSEFGAVSFDNTNVCTQTDTNGGYQMHAIGVGSANMTYVTQILDISFDSQDCFQNGPFQQPATDNVVVFSASMACNPSSVTRGQNSTCSITVTGAPTGSTISYTGWKFTDGTNNVTSNNSASSWSGIIVTSGTVSAQVTVNGSSPVTVSANLTVTNRTGFQFTAVNPSQVIANSLTCYSGSTTVTPSPPAPGSTEGVSCADQAYSFNFTAVSDGPNKGYQYVTSASNINGSMPTKFEYIVVSDLLNSSSAFYTHQCGDFSASNTSGFIAGSQLKQNVLDHEQGSVLSHWTEYKDAQNDNSNNIGTVLEAAIGAPGATDATFARRVGDAALARIADAVVAEPCGGLVTKDSSQSCALCGTINYSPYQSCGNTQPVPFCH